MLQNLSFLVLVFEKKTVSLLFLLFPTVPLRVFPENGMASVGEQVQFQCIPGLNSTVEWMFGNEILTGDGRYEVTEAGHLTLLNVSLSDAGEYVCTASNDFGAASVSVHVTVLGGCGHTSMSLNPLS